MAYTVLPNPAMAHTITARIVMAHIVTAHVLTVHILVVMAITISHSTDEGMTMSACSSALYNWAVSHSKLARYGYGPQQYGP